MHEAAGKPGEPTMTTTPQHVLKHIRLALARSKEFPNGSARHGYDLIAPLDKDGHIDPDLWRKHRDACRVRKFREGDDDAVGHLIHKPGGAEHARWTFEYGPGGAENEEAGFRFGMHAFAPGEYVSIKDEDGELHTFVVTSVEAVEK
jgi:hypothetical protein